MAEGRGWIVGVFLATLAVYALAAPQVLAYLEPPMGDQPHYLMTVISLVEDHDLDLRNNYTTAASDDEFDPPPMLPGYRGIAADYPLEPGSHAGPTRNRPSAEWYSKHGLGLPLLLVPGWMLGQALGPLLGGLTQSGGGGWPGAVFELNLFGALLAAQIFLLAWETTGDRALAVVIWAALALSSPLFSYSLLVFPELPAALLTIYAFRRLALGWAANGRWRLLLVGLCLGLLPWLQVRLVPISAGLVGLALFFRWRERPRPGAGPVVALVGPIVLLGLLLAGYYVWLYGSPFPNAQDYEGFFVPPLADAEAGPRAGLAAFGLAALGLFLDQQWGLLTYAPVYVLAIVGALALWQAPERRPTAVWLAAAVVPYVLLIADFRLWWGAWCAPARYLVPIVPLMAAPLAWSLRAAGGNRLYAGLFGVLSVMGLVIMAGLLIGLGDPGGDRLPVLYNNDETGRASFFLWLRERFGLDFVRALPGFTPWFVERRAELPWASIVALLGLLAGVVAVGTRLALRPTRGRTLTLLGSALARAHLGVAGLVVVVLVGTLGRLTPSPAPSPSPRQPEMVGDFVWTRGGQAAIVTNTLDHVSSFTVEATYRRQGTVVGIARADVPDLAPGQRRAVNLVASPPVHYRGNLSVGVGGGYGEEPAAAQRAEAAATIAFGPPRIASPMAQEVEATNRDSLAHSFTFQGMLFHYGHFVGLTTGRVDDLAPGETRTATLLADGRLRRYDQVVVAVDALLR